MPTTRRQFIQRSAGAVSASLLMPKLMFAQSQDPAAASGRKIIVVLQLGGANDGLNTVIPYSDARYLSLRPNLGFKDTDLNVNGTSFLINDKFGFHPAMSELKGLYDAGKVAAVLGVGYPSPNLSHFSSTDIWMTANLSGAGKGWLGRYADKELKGQTGLTAVSIGALPKILYAEDVVVPSISSFATFTFQTDARFTGDRTNKLNTFTANNTRDYAAGSFAQLLAQEGKGALDSTLQVASAVSTYTRMATYPANNALANAFLMIAQLAITIPGTSVFHLSIGGFDTHSQQIGTAADQYKNKLLGQHYNLWRSISASIDAFYKDMVAHNLGDQTLVMTYSEFGRRPNENASSGCDHGTASPMFLVGNAVKGGLYGDQPSLATTALDSAGNMRFSTDFRSVYATVLDKWLATDSQAVLGQRFDNLGFL
ncbi:MAG: DUF1501 domain-containing protein [Acidobacteria bacterium]|nr:DUF1501 domain-containing protein [Acidobacteriota bacterium]